MITVRHRAIHDGKPFTVWQSREPGKPATFAATFDQNRESIIPKSFPHATMFKAVDEMTDKPCPNDGQIVSKSAQTMCAPEIDPAPVGVQRQPQLVGQLTLWD